MKGTGLNNFPQFGVMEGVKILVCGGAIAGPFGATLLGEIGAEVVHFESPKNPDSVRGHYGYSQNHRNQLSMVADMKTPEGLEIFKKLIKWTDIFIESSKGGTYEKMGLTDEVLWEINPRLAIVHVSGFGQTGVPEYIGRASYDAVGQAFSGYMSFNGTPKEAMKVSPYLSDYVTALNTCWTALAAYVHVLRTGKGESVDVAQYESLARILDTRPMEYFTDGKEFPRTGNKDTQAALFSFYTCKDGGEIFIGMNGYGPVRRGYPLIGLPKPGDGDPEIDEILSGWMADTDLGRRLEAAMDSFMFRVSIAAGEFPMEEPQGQNRFFDRCAQYLLELSDELERNLYIEAIVKEYRRYGISVENLRKRVNSLAMKGTPAEKRIQPKSGDPAVRKKESAGEKSQKLMLTWLVTYPGIFETVEKYLTPSDFVVPLYKEVAEMLWNQRKEGDVNPARLLNAFTDSDEQKEVASLFNATIHLETREEQERAFSDALLRIKQESLAKKNENWDPTDMAALQELVQAKKNLEDLGRKRQQLHISFE